MPVNWDRIEADSPEEFLRKAVAQWKINRRRNLMEETSEEALAKINSAIEMLDGWVEAGNCCAHVCRECEIVMMHEGICGRPRIKIGGCSVCR